MQTGAPMWFTAPAPVNGTRDGVLEAEETAPVPVGVAAALVEDAAAEEDAGADAPAAEDDAAAEDEEPDAPVEEDEGAEAAAVDDDDGPEAAPVVEEDGPLEVVEEDSVSPAKAFRPTAIAELIPPARVAATDWSAVGTLEVSAVASA